MAKKYEDLEARDIVQTRVSITRRAWREKRDLWNEIFSLYRFWTNIEPDVSLGERSNIFVPLAFSVIETKTPRIVQALLSFDPFFEVEGRNARFQQNARYHSDLLWFQLQDEMNAFFPLMMWFKEALMYSNSYMFVGYEKEISKVRERFPVQFGSEIIGYDYRQVEDVTYDGPTLNHLDLFDCFPAPFGTRINGRPFEKMPYFIVRSEPTAEFLKDLASKGILDKKAVEDVLRKFPLGTGFIDRERTDRMAYNRMTTTHLWDKNAPRYEMFTMYEHDWWVSIIDTDLVRNSENPFGDNKIPIVQAIDTPVPHEHFGIGQIEPIIKMQYYANDIENLRLDHLMKSINPGSLISNEAFLDPQKFMDDPDGTHIVRGNPANAHLLIQRPNANAFNSLNEQLNIERLIDKTLGQSDIGRGQKQRGADTATENVALIEQMNIRFDLSTRLLKHESMMPLLNMLLERNQMFFPNEKEIRLHNDSGEPEFAKMTPYNLLGKYRFKIKTNPAQGNRTVYAQTLMKFLQIVSADEGRNPGLVREVAKFLDIGNLDEILANPAENAVMTIVQASQQGLLANSKQAALVLSAVLGQLAPQGSPIAQKLKGSQQKPARDEQDLARQQGQSRR